MGHANPNRSLQGMPTPASENGPRASRAGPPRGPACGTNRCETSRAPRRLPGRSPGRTCRRAGSVTGLARLRARPQPPFSQPSGPLPHCRGLPRGATRGVKKKTPPVPLPRGQAPRRPSGLRRAVIGGIPTPRMRRRALLNTRVRIGAAMGEKAATARHPPLSAPA